MKYEKIMELNEGKGAERNNREKLCLCHSNCVNYTRQEFTYSYQVATMIQLQLVGAKVV